MQVAGGSEDAQIARLCLSPLSPHYKRPSKTVFAFSVCLFLAIDERIKMEQLRLLARVENVWASTEADDAFADRATMRLWPL